jgi:hypothetical protein
MFSNGVRNAKPDRGDSVSERLSEGGMMAKKRSVEIKITHEDIEYMYEMQVLSLVNIARQIRDSKGAEVANRIDKSLPEYLETMLDFAENNVKTATFYAGGKLLKFRRRSVTVKLASAIKRHSAKQGQVLSDYCCKLAKCGGGFLCLKWPTSLQPVDPKKRDDNNGWRYIIDSHCGFKLYKPKKGCGLPLGLYQCAPPD